LQNCKSSGALNQNSQPGTVDLRSNGHGFARARWTAPCNRSSARDRTAQDACKRWAAETSPESGGARRELAGVGLGRHSRPSTRPQASTKRRGGACVRDRGVKGGDRASSAAGAGRGRRVCSGELVEALLCVKGREIGRGLMLTVACRTSSDGGSRKRSEGAGPRRRRSRRRSGGR
jgi:hypothetical protein